MFSHLQIYEPRERALVGLADIALAPLRWTAPWRSAGARPVRRVLLLRLERIGDLLMTLDAIAAARGAWPAAEIDLAAGSWNLPLARLIPGIRDVLSADVAWLAREGAGESVRAIARRARGWRRRGYDLAINFEPDIRSNAVAWLSGAPVRVGYRTGGGGAFLTDALEYDPRIHVSDNARHLVAHAAGGRADQSSAPAAPRGPRLAPDAGARAAARRLLAGAARPFVGVHAAGGRESKQWHPARFAEVARRLAADRGATIVLTGSAADRPLVDRVRRDLGDAPVIDAAGRLDLPSLAALLGELDVLVTGDTGPMHLAAAMDTAVVALFGPSNPVRYGPRARRERVLRIDLPCSPCGQVRLPPERCRGHVPDCLDGIGAAAVAAAAAELLDEAAGGSPAAAGPA
jgi:lipopolysaccharide heptosyltransferase II